MALQMLRRAVAKQYPLLASHGARCGRPSLGYLSRPVGWASVDMQRSPNFSTICHVGQLASPTAPLFNGAIVVRESFENALSNAAAAGLPGSIWLGSVIKKRKRKMNKHKLRKLRKKDRYKNKN